MHASASEHAMATDFFWEITPYLLVKIKRPLLPYANPKLLLRPGKRKEDRCEMRFADGRA